MLSVINNTTMRHLVKTDDWDVAHAWAETVPWMNDFSIVWHCTQDFSAYSLRELGLLIKQLAPNSIPPRNLTRCVALEQLFKLLSEHQITSDLPPDAKRVAPFTF